VEVERYTTAALSYWLPTSLSAVVAAMVMGGMDGLAPGLFLAGMGGALAGGLALSRAIFTATSRRWDERIRRLLAAMMRAAREPDEEAP
jgi:hypothetical protein